MKLTKFQIFLLGSITLGATAAITVPLVYTLNKKVPVDNTYFIKDLDIDNPGDNIGIKEAVEKIRNHTDKFDSNNNSNLWSTLVKEIINNEEFFVIKFWEDRIRKDHYFETKGKTSFDFTFKVYSGNQKHLFENDVLTEEGANFIIKIDSLLQA